MTDATFALRYDLMRIRTAILSELHDNDFYVAMSCLQNCAEKLLPKISIHMSDRDDEDMPSYSKSVSMLSQTIERYLIGNAFYTASQAILRLKQYDAHEAKIAVLADPTTHPAVRHFNDLAIASTKRVQFSIKTLQNRAIHFAVEPPSSLANDISTPIQDIDDNNEQARLCLYYGPIQTTWTKWHPTPYLPQYAPRKAASRYRQISDHRPLKSIHGANASVAIAVPVKILSKWSRQSLPRQRMIPRPVEPVKR